MADLNLDLNYFDHPKVKRLAGLLGRGSEVLPIKLWAYCGRVHPVDGRLTGYTPQEVESIVGWWGQAGQFVKAMLSVRFLEELADGGYQVHEWDEYQGHIGAFRERARKGAKARWAKIRGPSDASSIPTSNAKHEVKQCPTVLTNEVTLTTADAVPSAAEKPKRKPPTGPHAEVTAHYVNRWQERYRRDCPFGSTEGRKVKDLLEVCKGDAAEAKRVIDRYFANREDFYHGHPLTQLMSANSLRRFLVGNQPHATNRTAGFRREDN